MNQICRNGLDEHNITYWCGSKHFIQPMRQWSSKLFKGSRSVFRGSDLNNVNLSLERKFQQFAWNHPAKWSMEEYDAKLRLRIMLGSNFFHTQTFLIHLHLRPLFVGGLGRIQQTYTRKSIWPLSFTLRQFPGETRKTSIAPWRVSKSLQHLTAWRVCQIGWKSSPSFRGWKFQKYVRHATTNSFVQFGVPFFFWCLFVVCCLFIRLCCVDW